MRNRDREITFYLPRLLLQDCVSKRGVWLQSHLRLPMPLSFLQISLIMFNHRPFPVYSVLFLQSHNKVYHIKLKSLIRVNVVLKRQTEILRISSGGELEMSVSEVFSYIQFVEILGSTLGTTLPPKKIGGITKLAGHLLSIHKAPVPDAQLGVIPEPKAQHSGGKGQQKLKARSDQIVALRQPRECETLAQNSQQTRKSHSKFF